MLLKERKAKRVTPAAVIVVLLVLLVPTLAYMTIAPNIRAAKRHTAKKEILLLETSLGVLFKETGKCPVLEKKNRPDKFMKGKFTRDPWGNMYVVECPDNKSVVVFSAGPDGLPGTDDDVHGDDDERSLSNSEQREIDKMMQQINVPQREESQVETDASITTIGSADDVDIECHSAHGERPTISMIRKALHTDYVHKVKVLGRPKSLEDGTYMSIAVLETKKDRFLYAVILSVDDDEACVQGKIELPLVYPWTIDTDECKVNAWKMGDFDDDGKREIWIVLTTETDFEMDEQEDGSLDYSDRVCAYKRFYVLNIDLQLSIAFDVVLERCAGYNRGARKVTRNRFELLDEDEHPDIHLKVMEKEASCENGEFEQQFIWVEHLDKWMLIEQPDDCWKETLVLSNAYPCEESLGAFCLQARVHK